MRFASATGWDCWGELSVTKAYVHGVGLMTGWADQTASLERFIFDGVSAALADAHVPVALMDSLVIAAHDMVDGRSLSSMVTAPPAGAYMRDEIRVCEDGLAALSLAALRIEAGESDWSIVAAWGRHSEGNYLPVSRMSFDPFFEQPFSIDEFAVSAMRENAWQSQFGAVDPRAETRRIARAQANPRSSGKPVLPDGRGPLCDCVAAMIIGRKPSPIRISGLGHGTDHASVGDRDLARMPALRDAYAMAGGSGRQFDVYELDGATLGDEAISAEAVSLADAGLGFGAYADDARLNPSGGSAAGWAFPANGLRLAVEACLQMRGQAGPVQLAGPVNSACVSGLSPIGGQVATVVLLEAA